jgi:hypothetical protein
MAEKFTDFHNQQFAEVHFIFDSSWRMDHRVHKYLEA